ncbi:MAG: TIM barrel protein [Caldilineaceae bacterium]
MEHRFCLSRFRDQPDPTRWLDEYSLHLADTHGSEGKEKFWYAPDEYAWLAGIELVKNRIHFTAQLGGDAVVMCLYPPTRQPELARYNAQIFDQVRRSLDDLAPYAQSHGITIALENLIDFAGVRDGAVTAATAADNFDLILQLFDCYGPDVLGFCYDSGHAILGHSRMGRLSPSWTDWLFFTSMITTAYAIYICCHTPARSIGTTSCG